MGNWIDVKNKFPEEGVSVLVWKTNPDNPHWDTYGIGMFENNKWYLDGGTNYFPIVTHWCEIPRRIN